MHHSINTTKRGKWLRASEVTIKHNLQTQIFIVEHTLQDLHYKNEVSIVVPQALTN